LPGTSGCLCSVRSVLPSVCSRTLMAGSDCSRAPEATLDSPYRPPKGDLPFFRFPQRCA
jgi:hypothetical protein